MITFTDAAAEHIKKHLDGAFGLRLGLKKEGCSGFAYTVEYASAKEDTDTMYEDHGINILVNNEHLKHLDGILIDFVTLGHNQFLEYKNPNVKSSCGCGKSFSYDQ